MTLMTEDTLGLACKHGMLARSCEVCERDAEIADLRRQLSEAQEALTWVRSLIDDFAHDLDEYSAPRYIQQIAAALPHTYGDTVSHKCHWPGCDRDVPPRLWGCAYHWFRLPKPIRREILETYKPGQESRRDPTPEYLAAARKARAWITSVPSEPEAKT